MAENFSEKNKKGKEVLEAYAFRLFVNTIRTIWESKYEIWCEIVGEVPDEEGYYNFLCNYSQLWEVWDMPKCKGKGKGKR